MDIQHVTENDKTEILKLTEETWIWGDYVKDVFETWINAGLFLKAVEDQKILGIIHARVFEDFTWLEGLRIHKDNRRKGLGKFLTIKAIETCEKKVARLMIVKENEPSIFLAKSLGFRKIDEIYYNFVEEREFKKIVEDMGLKKSSSKLKSPYVDEWVWYPPSYYKGFIYEGTVANKTFKMLETKPVFLLKGHIEDIEYVTRDPKNELECFYVFEIKQTKTKVWSKKQEAAML